MENRNVENILLDINQKIKNRFTFSWKLWFGWLIIIPFILVGGLFIVSSSEYLFVFNSYYNFYTKINLYIGSFIIFIGALAVLKNWIQGVIALYKSTKDSKDVKEFRIEKYLKFLPIIIGLIKHSKHLKLISITMAAILVLNILILTLPKLLELFGFNTYYMIYSGNILLINNILFMVWLVCLIVLLVCLILSFFKKKNK